VSIHGARKLVAIPAEVGRLEQSDDDRDLMTTVTWQITVDNSPDLSSHNDFVLCG
jgi:hypothetical protein